MTSNSAACFAPYSNVNAKVLILGSIPGRASLKAQRYYAHPRNQFWPIMASLLGFAPDTPYADGLSVLQTHGIALWDVMRTCERPGSLDASIQGDTIQANDFDGFFDGHPAVRAVFFNGATAHAVYQKHVVPTLGARRLRYTRLPSTSPAHATLSLAQKRDAWNSLLVELRSHLAL